MSVIAASDREEAISIERFMWCMCVSGCWITRSSSVPFLILVVSRKWRRCKCSLRRILYFHLPPFDKWWRVGNTLMARNGNGRLMIVFLDSHNSCWDDFSYALSIVAHHVLSTTKLKDSLSAKQRYMFWVFLFISSNSLKEMSSHTLRFFHLLRRC